VGNARVFKKNMKKRCFLTPSQKTSPKTYNGKIILKVVPSPSTESTDIFPLK